MPTYEYLCDACGHRFDQFQSITAKPIRRCPVCRKLKLRRLIGTGAGIIFKGSGFYETDYRSEGYKTAAKADAPGADAKKESATETKPATDAPAKSETKTETRSESKPSASQPKTPSKKKA
jgi:putative FmdB family regulatory protein